ncbi:hypothetical protein CKF48_18275 [Cytobacillus kochii]|uniref:Bro-N domain-containing protein n=1 Tax=Cytobacillus kochii TaxID=859143 RepID=A0A248TLH8_9BACI|nr:hypothetical protein CKF48_18275 [Cytobacillus kochii]
MFLHPLKSFPISHLILREVYHRKLDEDERAILNIARQGNTNIINERGLYSIVMTSRKPEAREFKRWITQEIIPRKLFSKNI